ncbi:MAG: MBL fold metallo-hydrolase [Bacteroidota bacterium]
MGSNGFRNLAAAVFVLSLWGMNAPAQEFRVTLLGTGNPTPSLTRFGPSVLIQAGDETLVFDAGRGVAQRLYQLGVPFQNINAVFLTHLHSDHIVGLPDLWLTGWLIGRRTSPLTLIGPAGTTEMAGFLEKAFAFDVRIRVEEGGQVAGGGQISARNIVQGLVYEEHGVRVTAFDVDHGIVKPAFGYRIEYGGHSVVLSGDTRFSENVIEFSKGADVLIHEVVLAPTDIKPSTRGYIAFAHHTTPEQAAEVFSRVKPKLAVYSHIVSLWGLKDEELTLRTRKVYPGPFEVGEDLMSFVISDSVRMERPRK